MERYFLKRKSQAVSDSDPNTGSDDERRRAKVQKSSMQLTMSNRLRLPTDKLNEIILPNGWHSFADSVVCKRFSKAANDVILSSKVAAFDFDGCLWKQTPWKKQRTLPKGEKDSMMFNNIPDYLVELTRLGYRIVILSNDNIAHFKNPDPMEKQILRKIGNLEQFFESLKEPKIDISVEAYFATRYDKYRKQSSKDFQIRGNDSGGIGMWEILEQRLLIPDNGSNQNSESRYIIDKERSFFVGDAAGRLDDHSDADIRFAKQVGLKFFLPEDFFTMNLSNMENKE